MVTSDTHPQKIIDLNKYFGIYHKITADNIHCECFCSKGNCVGEFEKLGEVVIETYSNLFHVRCFLELYPEIKIKKPSFDEKYLKNYNDS